MVLVTDTLARFGLIGAILGRFLVVAVPMEQLKVHQPVVPAQALRDDVVGLNYPRDAQRAVYCFGRSTLPGFLPCVPTSLAWP